MKALNNMKMNVERYECAEDVVENALSRPITNSGFEDKQKSRIDDPNWTGVSTFKEALDLMRNGYQPAVDKIKEHMKVSLAGQRKRYHFEQSVAGFAPIVPLALMGVPNSMISLQQEPIKTKVIDVYYDMTVSCGTSKETIFKCGARMIGALLELEMRGYRFNLYAVQSYSGSSSADTLVVKIKSANLGLDIKRMSFPLTHPAFFRCIGFDWYSRVPEGIRRVGYGTALAYNNSQDTLTDAFQEMFGANAVFFAAKTIMEKDEEYIKEVLLNKTGNQKNGR